MAKRSKEQSGTELKAIARTFDEQVALEEGELERLAERARAEGMTRKQAVVEIVNIVMTRLDGVDPITRSLMRAKLLDRLQNNPAFADLGRIDWPEES